MGGSKFSAREAPRPLLLPPRSPVASARSPSSLPKMTGRLESPSGSRGGLAPHTEQTEASAYPNWAQPTNSGKTVI